MAPESDKSTYDPADSYDTDLLSPREPELDLPETSEKDIDKKLEAEDAKSKGLQTAIDTDIGADGTTNTQLSGVPIKNKYKDRYGMSEYQFDSRLRAKKNLIDIDMQRLNNLLEEIKGASKDAVTTLLTGGSDGSSTLERSVKSARKYLSSLKRVRRSKAAGRTAGNQASQTHTQ